MGGESVYYNNLINSNGSLNHSGDSPDGTEKETIYCNLDSVPIEVDKMYFLLTVATPDVLLGDVKNVVASITDTTTRTVLCQCTPKLAEYQSSMVLMTIKRLSGNWNASLTDDMNDSGTSNLPTINGTFNSMINSC